MWVKTLDAEDLGQDSESAWMDPSPDHDLRALQVPTLRASLGITGPPLKDSRPLPFGQLWNGQSRLEQCKVHRLVLYSGWTGSLHERTLQTCDNTLEVLGTRRGLLAPCGLH